MVTMLALVCCGELRRQTPHNYICLMIFTFAESLLLGIISAIHQREIVLFAVLITAVVCLALTAFAFQTKIDFTAFNGIVFVFLIVLMVMGIILMFWRNNILFLIYSGLGALVFSAVSYKHDHILIMIFMIMKIMLWTCSCPCICICIWI